ncbi:AMP-binding protein [Pseudonocardia sediminis]|uniref:AMP-binding protein n=1 Tax=Pseudonocardia sediminis TaxID=1397368 RepID=UPI001F5E9753|nr:AMP-binding protein [Pseudonocardia sediminis]
MTRSEAGRFPTVDDARRRRYRDTGLWSTDLLDAHVETVAARDPDRVAVVDGDRRMTYAELQEQVVRIAAGLRRLGVGRGEVVSSQLPNRWEALALHLAVIRIGAVSNPLMPILREREMRFALGSSGARVLVVAAEFRGFDHGALAVRLRDELPDLAHVVTVRGERDGATTFDDLTADPDGGHAEPGRTADDPVVLLYTSGTESDPKGAVHSHATLDHEVRSVVTHFGLTGDDVMFMPSPIAHITGVLYGFHLSALLGTTVVYQDVWEPGRGLDLIERHRISFVVAATPFLHGITYHPDREKHDVSSLRVFACGGADVPPDLIRDAERLLGCPGVRVYGSTEIPTLTMGHADDTADLRATTDGRVVGVAELKVLDDDGAPVGPGTVGNLHARGAEAFLGYLGRPRPTESSAGGTSIVTDDEGWIDTGDRGSVDAGDYLTVTGRSKDIILRGGENISAKEVEDLLYAHPDVADVAVVAVPDPRLTEKACAVVVPRPGTSPRPRRPSPSVWRRRRADRRRPPVSTLSRGAAVRRARRGGTCADARTASSGCRRPRSSARGAAP